MVSISTQHRILNLFQQIARGQKEVQTKRQSLAQMHEFSPYLAFRRLDRYDKDHLTSRDFLLFLNDNFIPISEIESYDLMKSFDKNGMGRVSFIDFRDGVLPSYSQVLRDVAGSRPSYRIPPYDPLPQRVERGLANLLDSEFRFQREVAQLRAILRRSQDFTVSAAFRSIASSRMYIYPNDIRDLFIRCRAMKLLPSEQQAILRRLDQDGDGKLSFNQFYDAICPNRPQLKAPQTSYAYQRSSPSPVRKIISYSPSPQWRSYRESESPQRRPRRLGYDSPIRKSYLEARTYYSPPSRPYYSPPSRTYYNSPARRPLRQMDYSPSRRSYQPSVSYQLPTRPLKQEHDNKSMIYGSNQPYEYSPLRGYTAIRNYPNSTSYFRSQQRQDDKKQKQASPFMKIEGNYAPSYNYYQDQMRIEQNKIPKSQEQAQGQDMRNKFQEEDQQRPSQGHQNQNQQMEQQNQSQELQAGKEQEYQKEPDVFQGPMEEQGQTQNQGQQNQQDDEQPLLKQFNEEGGQDPMLRPAYQDTPPTGQNQASSGYFKTPLHQLQGQSLNHPDPMASSFYSKYSPQKQRICGNLARQLRNQMAEDTRVEYLKQQLAIKADFNLHDAFDFFDKGKRGKLTSYDLKEAFMDLKLYGSREDAQMLIQKFDEDKDGMLNRAEFGRLFTPNDPISAQQLKNRQAFNSDGFYSRDNVRIVISSEQVFTKKTAGLMQEVLRALINSEKSVENVRTRLRLEGSTVRDAFEALDKAGKGHISQYDMSTIMDENYVAATKNELTSFMDRFDKDKDGRVSYSEFVDEMIPKSPSRIY